MIVQTYRIIENVATALSGLILLALAFIGILDVVAPKFGYPLSFVTELSQVGLAACIFLAMPRLQSTMSNITIDMVVEHLRPAHRDIALRVQYLLVALSLAALGYIMTQAAMASYVDGEYTPGGSRIMLWPFKACAAFGVSLASVGALTTVFRRRVEAG